MTDVASADDPSRSSWQEARERCEAALTIAREAQAPGEEAYTRMMLGLAQAYLGEPEAGETGLRHVARVFARLGRDKHLLYAHLYLAEALRPAGRIADALRAAVGGEQRARELRL